MKMFNGHFDGKFIVLDEPTQLKPNTKVKVIATDDEETTGALIDDYARVSETAFKRIWDNPLDADYDHL